MRSSFLNVPQQQFRYFPGGPLFESDRSGSGSLKPLGLGDDKLPPLGGILTFLKFTPEETENLIKAASSAIGIVGGIVSVVGAVTSVADLMNKLGIFGPTVDPTRVALENIGTRLPRFITTLPWRRLGAFTMMLWDGELLEIMRAAL